MLFALRFSSLVLVATLSPALATCQQSSPRVGTDPYENAHPYLDQPLEEMVKRVPELKGLEPAQDQQVLPTILSETAVRVDEFLDNAVDLLAREDVTRARLRSSGTVRASEHTQYNYLIVHHGDGLTTTIEEYREDSSGNRVEQTGLQQAFSLTSGFALTCIYFASDHRSESTFRYVGREMIGWRNTYVLAFAQRPDQARAVNIVSGTWGSVGVLVQGIAWVDEQSFQIIRMRTDLLAPLPQIGLQAQTTEVSFDEVRLQDVPNPLWLPSDVTVDAKFEGTDFRNEHRYTNYRRYRVSSKILAPN